MRLVWRHRVLTTDQLTTLGWNSYNTAKQRLATLHRLRALDRIRPWNPYGGSPWHYVLDTPGAEILAADEGMTLAEFGYRRDRILAGATSSQLSHTLGTNQVFVDLYARTREEARGAHLTWWTGRECAQEWGDIVRPDGAGTWTVSNRSTRFFVEYDNGTERLRRLREKVDAYHELALTAQVQGVVLFCLPSHKREAHLRRTLGSATPVPVATAVHGDHPAGQVWTRLDDAHLRPRHLFELGEQEEVHQPSLFGWEDACG
ncbi:replication-relaxation family protein [Nocardiopsis sp. HNM0947]|uniref:Replication-relaxation family protein n=2 Tax=Nocardiopsis coralli TaxID=2772213 RepID=A0ABR9NZZ8_9ACTN|nr:replication-relaxation family protein [Nocardiopsis coralli]